MGERGRLGSFECQGREYRDRYRTSFNTLKSTGILGETAAIQELADVDWEGLSTHWPASGADFNRMRSAVSRFLTITLGKHHAVRRGVLEGFPKMRESCHQIGRTQTRHAREHRLRERPTDDRGGLKHPLFALCKPVDACREHDLDAGRDLLLRDRVH